MRLRPLLALTLGLAALGLPDAAASPAPASSPGWTQGSRKQGTQPDAESTDIRDAVPARPAPRASGPPAWWKKRTRGRGSAGRLLVPEKRAAAEPDAADPKKPVPEGPILASASQLETYFATADHDANGWISFREAVASMGIGREAFRVYDHDRDGRLVLSEFLFLHNDSVTRTGGFRPPKKREDEDRARRRTAVQLLNAYDRDLDDFVASTELRRMLEDYRRTDVDDEVVLTGHDRDNDGRLSLLELATLNTILWPRTEQLASDEDPVDTRPGSIDELFGKVVRRDSSTPYPPLITGPVPHFRRLDLDNDGAISVEDLENLMRPMQLRLRIHALMNTLDLDGDGVLNEQEFERALVPG